MNDYLVEQLEDFVEWLRDCGQDAFYVFENTKEAIANYINEKER